MKTKAPFNTCCVQLADDQGWLIHEMMALAEPISADTFFRHVSQEEACNLVGHPFRHPSSFSLRDDWHVRYYRATWEGRPCFVMVHSAIEYIFQYPEANRED
jgi:hypothetical protein